jgi:hypothetical protein
VFGGGCAVGRVLCLADLVDLVWAFVFEGSSEVSSVDFIVFFFSFPATSVVFCGVSGEFW